MKDGWGIPPKERPLRASDRYPEVGDMLMWCGAGPFQVSRVVIKPGSPSVWYHGPMQNALHFAMRPFACNRFAVYVSRRDGGKVTTDAPDPLP